MATPWEKSFGIPTGPEGLSEADRAYATIRLVTSQDLTKSKQTFNIGLALIIFAGLILVGALVTVAQVIPHLNKTQFVMFERETPTGVVRRVTTLDGPFNPDARTRNYFLRNVVFDFETYRDDINTRLERLRHFIPADDGNKLYEKHYERMVKLSKVLGNRERLVVSISPFSAITEHKSGQALNQSIADVTIEQQTESGVVEVLHYRVTIGYRFRGYTKAELESTSENIVKKINENPLGMEVPEYYTELQVPPLKQERNP